MQIRLTVTLGPRGGGPGAGSAASAPGAAPACDVVVTAPTGTPLSAVTGALVSTATSVSGVHGAGGVHGHGSGSDSAGLAGSAASSADSSAAVYVGTERLDPHRQMLGEPPLLDGAVVSLYGPALPATAPALAAYGSAKARLHVIAGPDAGGIHLLQGGKVHLGRSAEADVPLDDPDVSRLHCAVTVSDGGAVTVTDLDSTNGTSLDGAPVGRQPVLFRPGSTLRVGESALRVETSPAASSDSDDDALSSLGGAAGSASDAVVRAAVPASLPTLPDGNGQLRLVPSQGGPSSGVPHGEKPSAASFPPPRSDSSHGYAGGPFPQGRDDVTHSAGVAQHARFAEQFPSVQPKAQQPVRPPARPESQVSPGSAGSSAPGAGESERPRGRGLGAWARRFAGPRPGEEHASQSSGPSGGAASSGEAGGDGWGGERRPDPATILLTALGPGPRLWEREPGHPDALTVRIGTAHRSGGRPGGPLTVDLRECGSLGLAGPRPRLMGLARSVVAQLAALHGPSTLEIVLLSTDRSRESEQRTGEWAWLGWLPHLRPVHGQDCRLLTAYDRDQAVARTAELDRRLDHEQQTPYAAGAGSASTAGPASTAWRGAGVGRRPGPFTLLVVDGDPGSATLRETVVRLAAEGPQAGIHLLCLAETPAATPSSPLNETVEAACSMSPAFRECRALALLSGAVATAVRVVRREGGGQGAARGPVAAGSTVGAVGTVGTVDAVSAAWAERFARAMAPLREPDGTAARTGTAARAAVTLPRTSRLLDELGLARATPAALLSRWAEPEELSASRATLVLGAGPRGPLEAELTLSRGHALVTGPSGSGKTELLRSLAASLSAGARPDRLQLVLLDGDGAAGREGLSTCLELPHARHHLAASDPVRMREFAQSLSGELKRRAELFGADLTVGSERVEQQTAGTSGPSGTPGTGGGTGSGSRSAAESDTGPGAVHGTLRLRTAQFQSPDSPAAPASPSARPAPREASGASTGTFVHFLDAQSAPVPRLVILVDDFDTLVDPALGNPGRPAAGSVVRALEAVARDGARLGMHVVAASGRPDRTAGTAVAQAAALRAELAWLGEGTADEDVIPGRGALIAPDGTVTAFQAGRITGRIPRTATQRPTVVPLEWTRAGDPPTTRPVRELGNGPTDLALLASAVGRAARSLGLDPQESGTPTANRSRSGQDEVLES
jgi:hypothetical protein